MRIGFLFNHDQAHQVAHSLPIALALARRGRHAITLGVTSDVVEAEVRRIAGETIASMKLVRLQPKTGLRQKLASALDRVVPANRLSIYGDNLDFFRQFDVLVVSEKTSLALKTRYGLNGLSIVHSRHGAGDRAIGFSEESKGFDLTLVAGPKIRDRLIAVGVAPEKIAITGYVKFDLLPDAAAKLPLQANGRPTVLYNPHPSPHLSSWYEWGAKILAQFADQDRYNLIFAPHVMLFHRPVNFALDKLSAARAVPPAPHYAALPHMLIDLGSEASTDMRYTQAADIYMGDASSQIYEFLVRPRPCLFLDAHDTAWRGDPNFLHWEAGPVATSPDNIIAQVDAAVASHAAFRVRQEELLASTFDVTGRPAAERAADAIETLREGAVA